MEVWSLVVGFVVGAVVAGGAVWVLLSRMCDQRVAEADARVQKDLEHAMREARDADLAHRETKERLIALQLEHQQLLAKAAEAGADGEESQDVMPSQAALVALPRVVAPSSNNLKRIRGIGRAIERRLNEIGISTIGQLAELSPGAIKDIDEKLASAGRVERERWVEQAQILLKEGAGAHPH